MIGIIDYGAGNLLSVANALARLGHTYTVCVEPAQLSNVERIILPGVGHYGAAARALRDGGMRDPLIRMASAGHPLLGICLGMQLLFEDSEEAGDEAGLALLPGHNRRLRAETVPHMGWNQVRWKTTGGSNDGHYYFAHGYVAEPRRPEQILATAELDGRELPAAVGRDRILGVQFHPEKSAELGMSLLEDFCRC